MNARRWKIMYLHAPFPPKPRWRIRIDRHEKHLYIDLGRIRIFRFGKTTLSIPCPKIETHQHHFWIHYDIDRNTEQRVWCTGDFLTTP